MLSPRTKPQSQGLVLRLTVVLFCAFAFVFPLVAHAGAKRKPKVLIVHATGTNFPGNELDVQSKLLGSGEFATVDIFETKTATPPLSLLREYDAALVYSDSIPQDSAALGNVLADYVDAGGGVVCSIFTTATVPLTGRWNPNYLVIQSGGTQLFEPAALDVGSITDQNHPILAGVASFNQPSIGWRTDKTTVVPGGTIVARWTNGGAVLAAAGPLPGRVDLNFHPPSKDANSFFWDTSTDGTKLLVNGLLHTMRPRILVIGGTFSAPSTQDIKTKLVASNLFSFVDTFDALNNTPTLEQLQTYDAAFVFSDTGFQNTAALGNVLADFVDSGGGVVNTDCIYWQNPDSLLGGRWASGAYKLLNDGISVGGHRTLGTVDYPAHPIMAGVTSFDIGTYGVHIVGATLSPGGFVVASLSDGYPLAVASTKMPNRAELNFYPPSDAIRSDFWLSSTGGGKLMANALLYTIKPYVLVAGTGTDSSNDVATKLRATRRFSAVDMANTNNLQGVTIKPYSGIFSYTNGNFTNPAAVSILFADYIDAGGGIVISLFSNVAGSQSQRLGARWSDEGFDITPWGAVPLYISSPRALLGTALEPQHPILRFVRKFDGGSSSTRPSAHPLVRGREILLWSDGNLLASVHNFRKRADLGMFALSNGAAVSGASSRWNQRTDGTWLMANSLEYVVRAKPCPGDFNGDSFVDDADFVLFVTRYDTLTDLRCDLTGDGLTDDADFPIFAQSYNALVCP